MVIVLSSYLTRTHKRTTHWMCTTCVSISRTSMLKSSMAPHEFYEETFKWCITLAIMAKFSHRVPTCVLSVSASLNRLTYHLAACDFGAFIDQASLTFWKYLIQTCHTPTDTLTHTHLFLTAANLLTSFIECQVLT